MSVSKHHECIYIKERFTPRYRFLMRIRKPDYKLGETLSTTLLLLNTNPNIKW